LRRAVLRVRPPLHPLRRPADGGLPQRARPRGHGGGGGTGVRPRRCYARLLPSVMPLQNAPAPPPPDPEPSEPLALGEAFEGLVDKLGSWLEAAILALPNFVVALVIVVVAALLARGARQFVGGVVHRVGERIEAT